VLESELGKQNPEPDGCAGSRKQRLEWQKLELGSGWCGHYDLLLTALIRLMLSYYRLKTVRVQEMLVLTEHRSTKVF
jgi:hypothetical protein